MRVSTETFSPHRGTNTFGRLVANGLGTDITMNRSHSCWAVSIQWINGIYSFTEMNADSYGEHGNLEYQVLLLEHDWEVKVIGRGNDFYY